MKAARQAKILEIISSKEVETQEQLLQELLKGGFVTTQATVSRDIKELPCPQLASRKLTFSDIILSAPPFMLKSSMR